LKRREEDDDVFGPTPRTLVQALEILGMKTPKHSDVIMAFEEPPAKYMTHAVYATTGESEQR